MVTDNFGQGPVTVTAAQRSVREIFQNSGLQLLMAHASQYKMWALHSQMYVCTDPCRNVYKLNTSMTVQNEYYKKTKTT